MAALGLAAFVSLSVSPSFLVQSQSSGMIDVAQWRSSVGLYNAVQWWGAPSRKARSKANLDKVRSVGCCAALMLLALLPLTLLPLSGDVETNPGPPKIAGKFERCSH